MSWHWRRSPLIATLRCCFTSSARYSVAIPPSPSSPSIVWRPLSASWIGAATFCVSGPSYTTDTSPAIHEHSYQLRR
jgi:hypothetical protein